MRLQKWIATLNLIGILLAGLMIASKASASEGTVCIQRTTAEACRQRIEKFDELAAEARAVRQQRDEVSGARNELRLLYFDVLADSHDWKTKAEAAQAAADAAPSRLVWFGAGAGVGVGATVLLLLFVQMR